ncbi:MAG: ABC transporter substrate-binding protein [Pseudomonadota bacterium]
MTAGRPFLRQVKRLAIGWIVAVSLANGALADSPSPPVSSESSARPISQKVPPVFIETPELVAGVRAGRLTPVSQRLPNPPRVIDPIAMGGELGRHGGRMRWLMGKQKDLRMVVYYGYSRLVGYNRAFKIVPDILQSFEVKEDRIFTLFLRPGHKWSDGHPFTAEDFRYWFEDVAGNKKVGKGFPPAMLVGEEAPRFDVLDKTTVRYTWAKPNPNFLPGLAAALPITIALPAHYLKKFHPAYADAKSLAKHIEQARVRNARALHIRKARLTRPENPELPVLDAWVNSTTPPSSLFVFKRNPYFHRVDTAGRQLPYVNEILMPMGSTSLIPAKTGSGESDLQARYLRFDDYTFLKSAEKRGRVVVRLWDRANGSHMTIVPNLNAADPTWRSVIRDVRFRRALSLAINRREINMAIFYGLARVSADTVLPQSPLYREAYANAWINFDLTEANRLLDEIGLTKRASDGIRLLPDGQRMEIILEASGESSEQADILALIKDTWRKIGIAMFPRPTQRDLFRKRVLSGQTIMAVWSGLDNGLATAAFSPEALAPAGSAQLQWPQWGQHYETNGKQGRPPDMPAGRRLLALLKAWQSASGIAERRRIWHQMLAIHAENVFTIGIVNGTKQPVVTSPTLANVPATGVFAYEPGGYFGLAMPDTFFFKRLSRARLGPNSELER